MPEIVTAFWVGLLAANSPCVLPLYPGFLAYLSGTSGTGRRPQTLIATGLLDLQSNWPLFRLSWGQ